MLGRLAEATHSIPNMCFVCALPTVWECGFDFLRNHPGIKSRRCEVSGKLVLEITEPHFFWPGDLQKTQSSIVSSATLLLLILIPFCSVCNSFI